MTSFTSRYGEPAADYRGAHVRAHRRHGATVVAVSGRVDARNLRAVADHALRFIPADTPFVLDLSAVTEFTPRAADLLDIVDQRCAAAGVDWALVPGLAAVRRMRGRTGASALPVISSVARAEHEFDDAVLKRRRLLLPLLGRTA